MYEERRAVSAADGGCNRDVGSMRDCADVLSRRIRAILGPRLAVAVWWLFGDKVEVAFDSWIWPLLGLVFLPWTTLAFLIAWEPGGLNGNWDAPPDHARRGARHPAIHASLRSEGSASGTALLRRSRSGFGLARLVEVNRAAEVRSAPTT